MKKFLAALLLLMSIVEASFALPVYESAKPPVLVQGAMESETDRLISALDEPVSYDIAHWRFFAGKIDGYPVVVSVTRCGMVNASASTALALETFRPCAVINQGTAGAHDPVLRRGDIVVVSDCFNVSAWKALPSSKDQGVNYRDIGLLDLNFYDEYESGNDITFIPSDGKLKGCALAVKGRYSAGKVVEGRVSTSDSWENRIDRILFLHERFGSSCEEMESFAVAKVCRIYGVPFLGVRVISNSALTGESFDPKTGGYCQDFVIEIVKQYVGELEK